MTHSIYRFTEELNWWGDDIDQNFKMVKNIFKDRTNLYFLEIGVQEAKSSCWMLDNILCDPGSHLHCIDIKILDNGRYNLSNHKDKYTLYEDFSENVLIRFQNNFREFFDFVYVDGSHFAKDVLTDLVLSWRLLKKNGIMLMDDYRIDPNDIIYRDIPHPVHTPKIAIDPFMNIYTKELKILAKNYQICIQKVV
jgi:predicted O-methyltransferase YrrM